jgi:hypothetical protein
MKSVTIQLPDDLSAFVDRSIQDGNFSSVNELIVYAIGLVRTESMLGHIPTPSPVSSQPKLTGAPATVDMTRHGFDSPSFMANLVGKLEQKRAEERTTRPPQ